MTTEVRRSERSRKVNTTVYDQARQEIIEKSIQERQKKKGSPRTVEDEDSSQGHSQEEEEPSEDEESSDDEEMKRQAKTASVAKNRTTKKPAATTQSAPAVSQKLPKADNKKSSNSRKKKTSPANDSKIPSSDDDSSAESEPVAPNNRKRKITQEASKGAKTKTVAGAGGGGPKNVKNALQSLYDHIIDEDESVTNSLLAALLKASHPTENNNKVMTEYSSYLSETHSLSWPVTPYTPQLYDLARRMIRLHNEDPNKAQIQCINLIFRSVGGIVDTNISPNVSLDHLEDSKWTKMIKKVVQEIEHTPIQYVLICADPLGAVHAASVAMEDEDKGDVEEKHSSLAVREFRKIYEEFWYVLGVVALTEGNMSAKHHGVDDDDNDEEEEEEENAKKKRKVKGSTSKTISKVSTHRFDADLVGEIMNRLMYFTTNNCTEIRAAATVAVIHLGLAVVDRTVLLVEKLNTTTRQYNSAAAGSSSSGRKADTLRNLVDSLKRNRKDLEEVLTKNVVDALILHRYRDINFFIRVIALEALGRLITQRPDLFLHDRYLKYFGWMLSDKSDRVRTAALNGLLGPFIAVLNTRQETRVIDIDLRQMDNIATKFINRIADCVLDVNTIVQEKAMVLLLFLLRNGFLDEVEDDNLWNQINLRAISPDASPQARMNALYFIMEQLEAFDDGTKDNSPSRVRNNPRPRTDDDRTIAQRLDAIASWIANALADGPIPLDKIQVSRVDYVVDSLRNMPEHKVIVTKWPVLLNAVKEDNIALTLQGTTAGDRVDAAKQRVLVEMFVCSVLAEVKDGSTNHLGTNGTKKKIGSKADPSLLQDSLSLYLIQCLAGLLAKFKGDQHILESLVTLPQHLSTNVLTATQYKPNFDSLLKILSDIFLQSSDEIVLYKIVMSLSHLSQGQNARAKDTQATLSNIVKKLYDRIVPYLSLDRSSDDSALEKDSEPSPKKASKGSRRSSRLSKNEEEEEEEETTAAVTIESQTDFECSLSLNLLRLKVLSYRLDISSYFERDTLNDDGNVENFINMLMDGLTHRLNSRFSRKSNLDWSTLETSAQNIDAYATVVVDEGLQLILALLAWNVSAALTKEAVIMENGDDDVNMDSDGNDSTVDHFTLRLRNRLITLVGMCFDQFILEEDEESACVHRVEWSHSIQESAGLTACDLRMLFPKEWAETASPLLRALAITDDSRLIAGYVRYLRSSSAEMLESGQSNETTDQTIAFLLEPIARGLAVSWKNGNRREAGVALTYLIDAGNDTTSLVECLTRYMKSVDPTRLLEAQMASLRQNYENWMENEPEEIEGSRPSDAQMAAFRESEKKHEQQLEGLVVLASKFSSSMLTRKKSEMQHLSPGILGFIREGVRYAFSNTDDDGDEVYVAGSRLSFLLLLTKYSNWIKNNKSAVKVLEKDLEQRERDLQAHEEFDQVRNEDIDALKEFREAFGLKPLDLSNDDSSEESEPMEEDTGNNKAVTPEPSSLWARSRNNTVAVKGSGSIGTNSLRSRISSNPSTLSPLYEEDHTMGGRGEEEDDEEEDDEEEEDDDEEEEEEDVNQDDSVSHDRMSKRVSKDMMMNDTQTTFDGVASM